MNHVIKPSVHKKPSNTNFTIPWPRVTLVTLAMRNQHRPLVVLSLPIVWLLLHPVGAPLVPEAMNLPENLAIFCPVDDVCPEKIANDWNDTGRTGEACCSECSCDDACVQTNNCCFPPTDVHPDSKCFYPTTQPSAEGQALLYKSYRMIDHDASKNISRHISGPSVLPNAEKIPCGEVSYPPFGNLFPVYSKQLNKIYKNPACAASHGVYDAVIWQPRIVCNNRAISQGLAAVQMLEYGIILDVCYVDFVYTGSETDLDSHACYRDMKHTCDRDSFPILEKLNISDTQVRALCESGFISPVRIQDILYANVFCHICNNNYHRIYSDLFRFCTNSFIGRNDKYGLSYLLKVNRLGNQGSTPKGSIEEVCDDTQGTVNSSRCRELKCPISQIRGRDGQCDFMVYNKQDTNTYMIFLKVHIDGYFNISTGSNDDFKESMDELIRVWNKVNPWPKSNYEGHIFCELDHQNYSNPQAKSLFVKIRVSPVPNQSFQTVLRNVKTYLNKRWVIKVNGAYIELHQSFAKFSEFRVLSNEVYYGYPKGIPVYYKDMDPAELLRLNITAPLILTIYYTQIKDYKSRMHLNKLYYCKQIELQSSEFIAYNVARYRNLINARAIYNKLTGRLMLKHEFWLVRLSSEQIVARICLSDSGYTQTIQTSGTGPMDVCLILVLTLGWNALQIFAF